MFRELLRGKIHGATVTGADLHYEGSIAIDTDLLAVAGIVPLESVQVRNVNNSARFETYTIASPGGSGEVSVNGAAARQAEVGDRADHRGVRLAARNGDLQAHTRNLVDGLREPRHY